MAAKMERCEFCQYFAAQSGESDLFSDLAGGLGLGPETGDGRCRRYPPGPNWPSVMMTDWCGEFLASGQDNVVKLETK